MSIRTKFVLALVVAGGFSATSGLFYWTARGGSLDPVEPVSLNAITKARLARKLSLALERHGNDPLGCASTTDETGRDSHLLAMIAECEAATGELADVAETLYKGGKRRLAAAQDQRVWLADLRSELTAHTELIAHVTSLPVEMPVDHQQVAQQAAAQQYRQRVTPLAEQYVTSANEELAQQTEIVTGRMREARMTKDAAAAGATVVALLSGAVVALLLMRRLRPAADRAAAIELEQRVLTQHAGPFDSTEVLDLTQALHQIGGDTEILTELINTATTSLPALLADLTDCISRNDVEQASDTAHSIKSVCARIGAHEAFTAAFACEVALRDSETDPARLAATALAEALDHLLPRLAQHQGQATAATNPTNESL